MVIVSARAEKNLEPSYINLRRMEPSTKHTRAQQHVPQSCLDRAVTQTP
jgi:hypothetical protein